MILYRVVESDKSIENEKYEGFNTYQYDNTDNYIHFFILPENAKVFKHIRYDNNKIPSLVYKCDIPYSLIKDNFGCGMYRWYYPNRKTPFLEVRIKKDSFKESYIIEKSETIKEEWFNNEIYNRFMKTCVDSSDPIHVTITDKLTVTLNDSFNFLDYFPKEDLIKEGLDVTNYPKPIDPNSIVYNNQIKKRSNKKNLLLQLRQKIIKFIKPKKAKK